MCQGGKVERIDQPAGTGAGVRAKHGKVHMALPQPHTGPAARTNQPPIGRLRSWRQDARRVADVDLRTL